MERFAVESVTRSGDNDEKILRLCGKSASMRKELKEQSSEPFDNQTFGEIVEMLSKRHGYQAKISQQFTEKTLPYVIVQINPPLIFLTRLADRMQAHFLIKNNKFLLLKCHNLLILGIHKHDCSSWDFTLEPHTQYSTIEASYFDRAKGNKTSNKSHSYNAAFALLLSPCKEEDLTAAAPEPDRLCRAVKSGSL